MAAKVSGHLQPWDKLDNEVVLVTGASSGLGRDLCLDLAKAGCRIIAAARRLDRLHSLCHQINTQYGTVRAVAVELDVSADPSTINKSVQKAWDAFGHIDTLINNAGIRGIMK
jgi:NADP-dependent 3-hydroxy acid dehydrogenase YdfG